MNTPDQIRQALDTAEKNFNRAKSAPQKRKFCRQMADLKQTLLDAIYDAAHPPQTQKPIPALGKPFEAHKPISRQEAAQWLRANRANLMFLPGRGYYMTQGGKQGLVTREL